MPVTQKMLARRLTRESRGRMAAPPLLGYVCPAFPETHTQ